MYDVKNKYISFTILKKEHGKGIKSPLLPPLLRLPIGQAKTKCRQFHSQIRFFNVCSLQGAFNIRLRFLSFVDLDVDSLIFGGHLRLAFSHASSKKVKFLFIVRLP